MGQVFSPSAVSMVLTPVDRLYSVNANGGTSPLGEHQILMGEDAGHNLGDLDYIYVLGAFSLSGGVQSAAQNGTTILGGQILPALTNATPAGISDGPIVAIGYNIAPALVNRMGSSQLIGSNILANYPADGLQVSANVYIGDDILRNSLDRNGNHGADVGGYNVVLGWRAMRLQALATPGAGLSVSSSVIIGAEIGLNGGFDLGSPGTTVSTSVLIGRQVATQVCSQQNETLSATVAIGNQCVTGMVSGERGVFVGSGISAPTLQGAAHTYVGSNIIGNTSQGTFGNVLLGASIVLQGNRSGCIILGYNANSTNDIPANHCFLVEDNDGSDRRTILFGRMGALGGSTGLVVGHSSQGTNRDLPGTNLLKVLTGTYSSVAPVGGGVFYYDALTGLHFVGANGTDTVLALP